MPAPRSGFLNAGFLRRPSNLIFGRLSWRLVIEAVSSLIRACLLGGLLHSWNAAGWTIIRVALFGSRRCI
jgi:hypothetical protein